jgi:CheY-like chemotaxis protein
MQPPTNEEESTGKQIRVLLVDDDPLVGVAFSRMLSPFQVTFAQSAAGALARLQVGGRFDAILCDIYMPGLNGMQFHDEVERISPQLARGIIYMSGNASAPDAAEFLQRVGNPCLPKPVKREALRKAVLAAAHGMKASADMGGNDTP